MKFKSIPYILFLNFIFATFSTNININNQGSFSIPFSIKYAINEKFSIEHVNRFYKINHPHNRFLYASKIRNDMTMITEKSFILYKENNINLKFGRDYIQPDVGSISDPYFSKYSPSLDQFLFEFVKKNISFKMAIIMLDNENCKMNFDNNTNSCGEYYFNQVDNHIKRWFYYKHLSFKINEYFTIGLSDAIISTGINRNIEFYYLLPFGSFQAEQLHNFQQQDGMIDNGEPYGINNDNGFIGIDLKYQSKKEYSFYTSLVIDDFQIDKEDRDHMQDVFGFLIGFKYKNDSFQSSIDYSYASPWLYINNGLLTSYTHNNFPLGFRNPHSQSLDIFISNSFNQDRFINKFIYKTKISFLIHIEEKGDQDINTTWDAWDNKIKQFNFSNVLPIEFMLKYEFNKKYIPNIIYYNNWMQLDENYLVLEWNFNY